MFYSNRKSDDLIIIFNACTRPGIKARYNYVRTLKKIKVNKLFILDDGGIDNRGTYYLGKYPEFDFENGVLELIKNTYDKINPKKIYFIGSSKGGWAALNFGLEYENSNIICGAPQYYLGTYLANMKNKVTLNSIGCISKKEINFLDKYLQNKILNFNYKNNIYLQYSINDPTYNNHIKYLIKDLKKKNTILYEEKLEYKNHDDVSIYFPNYIISNITNDNRDIIK